MYPHLKGLADGLFRLSRSMVCVILAFLRKGPIERVSFPATSATVSPYQTLAQYIMILGQKIDSATDVKAPNMVCILSYPLTLVARPSLTHMSVQLTKQRSSLDLMYFVSRPKTLTWVLLLTCPCFGCSICQVVGWDCQALEQAFRHIPDHG